MRPLAHRYERDSDRGTESAPAYPLFHPDLYPAYARLREEGRAHWFAPTRQRLVPRHEDVNALPRNRALGRTYLHRFNASRNSDVRRLRPTIAVPDAE